MTHRGSSVSLVYGCRLDYPSLLSPVGLAVTVCLSVPSTSNRCILSAPAVRKSQAPGHRGHDVLCRGPQVWKLLFATLLAARVLRCLENLLSIRCIQTRGQDRVSTRRLHKVLYRSRIVVTL